MKKYQTLAASLADIYIPTVFLLLYGRVHFILTKHKQLRGQGGQSGAKAKSQNAKSSGQAGTSGSGLGSA